MPLANRNLTPSCKPVFDKVPTAHRYTSSEPLTIGTTEQHLGQSLYVCINLHADVHASQRKLTMLTTDVLVLALGRQCKCFLHGMQEFYGITLEALAEAKNERLWFKTQLKLCSLWLKLHEYSRATKLLKELHRCAALDSNAAGLDKPNRASEICNAQWRCSEVSKCAFWLGMLGRTCC